MMGPNTTTGHLSVIYTTECQINFTMRVLRPILGSSSLSKLNPFSEDTPDTVAVTPLAEMRENTWIQNLARTLVWASGCSSWYVDARTGRNTMLYPDWQWKYWLRSIFIPLKRDFVYDYSPVKVSKKQLGRKKRRSASKALGAVAVTSGLGVAVALGMLVGSDYDIDAVAQELREKGNKLLTTGLRGLKPL